jgi:hypothetical protein
VYGWKFTAGQFDAVGQPMALTGFAGQPGGQVRAAWPAAPGPPGPGAFATRAAPVA